MDVPGFRELLIGYLTDPPYAEAEKIHGNGLAVTLPDGSRFGIELHQFASAAEIARLRATKP